MIKPKVNNPWITLAGTRNGVTVQRKYAGHSNAINHEDDSVDHCTLFYWEQELYPNGLPIAVVRKSYHLMDLPETITDTYRMEELFVLTNFIQQLGQPAIVDKVRETLVGSVALPIDAPDGYILHLETREQLPL